MIIGYIVEEHFVGDWLHPNMWPQLICTEDDSLLMNESATIVHFRKLAVSAISEYADRKQLAEIDCSLKKLESCKDIGAIEFALSNRPKR